MSETIARARELRATIRSRLEDRGLLGLASARERCAARARELGGSSLREIESLVGASTARRALAIRRGADYAESYRHVLGYGELMTELLIAPIPLDPAVRVRVARLGGHANLIVSYFDEMVDGGWPRSSLLPRWVLDGTRTRMGRVILDAIRHLAPAPADLTARLVSGYFQRLADLPHAARHRALHAEIHRLVVEMYLEEGRTPREWLRIRGTAARQKKTALPLVVLGLPGWLATPVMARAQLDRHRRWLVRLGKFIRWIDDASDVVADEAAGGANLVLAALRRNGARPGAEDALAMMIARRGSRLREEWRAQMRAAGHPESGHLDVLGTVLVAWLGDGSSRTAAAVAD